MERRSFLSGFSLGLGLLVVGCGGGGGPAGSGGTTTLPMGAKGQVVLLFEVQTTPAFYQQIKTSIGPKLIADGETFDDANHAIAAKPVPLVGHWLKIGNLMVMTDKSGNFVLPAGTSGKTIGLYKDPGDSAPQATFPLSTLNGQKTNTLNLNVIFQGPVDMGAPSSRSPSLMQERCLDWDGPFGDHMQHDQQSLQGVKDYIKSTCWKNVDSGLCYNEGNTIKNTVTLTDGPHCYQNHKYRMCQSIDESQFKITDSDNGSVPAGSTDSLTITNNTAGNETVLTLSGPGTLSDPKDGGSGSSIIVKHYDDPSTTHLINRTVTYTADENATSGTATITAQSHGNTISIILTLSSFAGSYSGTYTGSDSTGEADNGTFSIKINSKGEVSGTALYGPLTLDVSGSVNPSTGAVKFGTAYTAVIQATYSGTFVNNHGKVSGSGTWNSINSDNGVTGSGSWKTN